ALLGGNFEKAQEFLENKVPIVAGYKTNLTFEGEEEFILEGELVFDVKEVEKEPSPKDNFLNLLKGKVKEEALTAVADVDILEEDEDVNIAVIFEEDVEI